MDGRIIIFFHKHISGYLVENGPRALVHGGWGLVCQVFMDLNLSCWNKIVVVTFSFITRVVAPSYLGSQCTPLGDGRVSQKRLIFMYSCQFLSRLLEKVFFTEERGSCDPVSICFVGIEIIPLSIHTHTFSEHYKAWQPNMNVETDGLFLGDIYRVAQPHIASSSQIYTAE